jgi:hypothetical protein
MQDSYAFTRTLRLRVSAVAAAELRKFIDHHRLVVNFTWSALARLQLAPAYAMQGDTAKAKLAYQDFIALADPDIPACEIAIVDCDSDSTNKLCTALLGSGNPVWSQGV